MSDPEHPSHPAHPVHPEHPDSHPFRAHHPHASLIRAIIAAYVGFVLFVLIFTGIMTNADFGSVIAGFIPALLFGIIGILLLNTDHFDLRYLLVTLVGILIIFGVLYALLLPDVVLSAVLGINFVLGVLLLLVISQSVQESDGGKTIEVTLSQQELPELVGTIEDRCKALNFVIGRVYSTHHGANKGMREKLRIDNEWYNELSELLEEEIVNPNLLRGVVERIRQRLILLERQEKSVFSESEVESLKDLDRKDDGTSRIRDVLDANDKDPADQYITSAIEFCEAALTKLDVEQGF